MGMWIIQVSLPGLHFELGLVSVDFEGDGHVCLASDGVYPHTLL